MNADVVWFADVNKGDLALAGGKGANLGELYSLKIPVPDGFIVTADAYFAALSTTGIMDRIRGLLFGLNVDDPNLLLDRAKAVQMEIKNIKLDKQLEKKIDSYYRQLVDGGNRYVAVRSSATAEDLPEASFAGQQATFLNIAGEKELVSAILGTWASLFEARAIFYRAQMRFDHFKVGIATLVQLMVQSEVSGVMFTVDPVSGDKNKIIIEAVFGLGELIVSGQVTPDHYEVDKKTFKILAKSIAIQEKQLVGSIKGNRLVEVAKVFRNSQKLGDAKIVELARLGTKIERHYFFPQDVEWALAKGKLYIVQTRPVTTLKQTEKADLDRINKSALPNATRILLQGAPASPQIATGKVVIVKSVKELAKVERGNVLVAEVTNPDYVPAMRKAVAIVTDRGGRTSHAAIVSRELGIACVVGTGEATKKLKEGTVVTVDGLRGIVFKGQLVNSKKSIARSAISIKPSGVKTATKLYVNLAEPELAKVVASQNVDGVGLLRAEFLLAKIGTHPKKFISEGKQNLYITKLSDGLATFCRAFAPRPVVYRASDFKSNEYRNLAGGDRYEPEEANPMLGFRGAFRFIRDPDVFKLELAVIKKVRERYQNLQLMIPYVRNVSELVAVRSLVSESGLFADRGFKFWMMVEIPANVIMLEDFIKAGIDGVSIGSNDLTMLILGTDRDNEEVASEFSELDPAVMWCFEKVIKTCNKYKITSSICGQAPSIYSDLAQKLVSWGITSISVNPDSVDATRQIIHEAEQKLVNR